MEHKTIHGTIRCTSSGTGGYVPQTLYLLFVSNTLHLEEKKKSGGGGGGGVEGGSSGQNHEYSIFLKPNNFVEPDPRLARQEWEDSLWTAVKQVVIGNNSQLPSYQNQNGLPDNHLSKCI